VTSPGQTGPLTDLFDFNGAAYESTAVAQVRPGACPVVGCSKREVMYGRCRPESRRR
jgi:hypothetical protein